MCAAFQSPLCFTFGGDTLGLPDTRVLWSPGGCQAVAPVPGNVAFPAGECFLSAGHVFWTDSPEVTLVLLY